MSVWLILWIVVSVALLGFLGWSLLVLHNQKTAWKKFAAKHKLRYRTKATMDSPEIDGSFDGYKIDIFTGEHTLDMGRSMRKLTAIEVSLQSKMPVDGAVASGGMIQLVKGLGFKSEVRPEHELWNSSYMATGDNARAVLAYLNKDRLEALIRLMRIKHSWVILIFRNDRMLLRVDTPDPLTNLEYLERLVNLLVKSAKELELKSGESRVIEAEEAKGLAEDSRLVLDDGGDGDASSLSLEDDEDDAEVEAEDSEPVEPEAETEEVAEAVPEEKSEKKDEKPAAKKKAKSKKSSAKKP